MLSAYDAKAAQPRLCDNCRTKVSAVPAENGVRAARFGDFEVNFELGELRKRGHKLHVPDQAIQVLEILLSRPGELVTREQLQARLWPDGTVVEFDNGINSSIRRLRAALGDSAEQPRYIETLPKRGYRFIFACDPVQAGGQVSRAETPGAQPLDAPKLSKKIPKRAWVALGAAGLTVLLSFGVYRFRTAPVKPITSIAVLPLVNAGHDPGVDYLSDGISEELINVLSEVRDLKVIARNTAFHFRGQEVNAKKIGQELGVRALLTGTLIRNGNTVIVQTDLVNVEDGSELWGERYKRNITDFQGLESDIARQVADALRLRLAGDEQQRLKKRYTENSEAYQLYLKGIYAVGDCCEPRSLDIAQRSISYFQQAIAKDPHFALAYFRLALRYNALGSWRRWPAREAFAKAKEEAEKALRIDDSLGEAHAELAFALVRLNWDWPGAERELKRAIDLNPNYAHAAYSWYLMQVGRTQEGLLEAQRAIEIDPLSQKALDWGAFTHYTSREYDQAIAEARKGAAGKPSFFVALALEQKGMYDEAIANLEQLGDSAAIRGHLGHVYAMAGNSGQAQKIIRELQPRTLKQEVGSYEIAFIYAALGQKDRAFEWLEKAYQQHDSGITYLKTDPSLDPLRQDPRFEQLERRVGLEP